MKMRIGLISVNRAMAIIALVIAIGVGALISTNGARSDLGSWSINAGSNNAAPPNGFPEGQSPASLNDGIRELMAQVRRFAEQKISATFATEVSTGPNSFKISPYVGQTNAIAKGSRFVFQASTTNTGAATVNVSAISTFDLKLSGSDLSAGAIVSGKWVEILFDGSAFQVLSRSNEFSDPTTTRGDLLSRGASSLGRLALGSISNVVASDGTDVVYRNIAQIMDALGNVRGSVILRGATGWTALIPGTAKQLLQTQGSGADPTWATAGLVVQQKYSAVTAFSTTTTILPYDNSLPQSGEGAEILTISITPTSATNILEITCYLPMSSSAAGTFMTAALFQNTDASAIAVGNAEPRDATGLATIPLYHRMVAATTAAQTFKVRGGGSQAATTTFNGFSGGQAFSSGTTSAISSNCTIHELTP